MMAEEYKSPSFAKEWQPHTKPRPSKVLSRRLSRILAGFTLSTILLVTLSYYNPARSSPILYAVYQRYIAEHNATPVTPPIAKSTPQAHLPVVGIIAEAYETERLGLLYDKNYNEQQVSFALGTPPTSPLDSDLQAYTTRLRTFVNAYFPSSPHQPHLLAMLNDLDLHIPPVHNKEIPRVVMSTSKSFENGMLDLPEGFAGWSNRLGPEGWEIRVADDKGMEDWFEALIEGIEGSAAGLRGVWGLLPKKVLKSDLLR
jgi:hypothetical protein